MTVRLERGTAEAAGAVTLEIEESLTSKHPNVHRMLSFYQARRQADGLLPRAALQPRELVDMLPSLFIAEPMRGGDWRFRLVGTGLVDRLGVESTGKTVRGLYDARSAARVIDIFERAARGRHTVMCRCRFIGLDIAHLRCESVHAPLLAADGRTTMILGALFFS